MNHFGLQMYARFAVDLDQKQHENVPLPVKDFTTQLLYEPKGVIACITPWNYPLLMAMQKVSAAWAAGCAVVLKPSELAPATCLLLGEIAQEAGIPAGALNIVPGLGNVTGQALAEHEDVDFVSFTGSVRTGQHIMRAAATTGPRGVSLELGGKSSMIVFDDVDVEATVGIRTTAKTCWHGSQLTRRCYGRWIGSWSAASGALDKCAAPPQGCFYTETSRTPSCNGSWSG